MKLEFEAKGVRELTALLDKASASRKLRTRLAFQIIAADEMRRERERVQAVLATACACPCGWCPECIETVSELLDDGRFDIADEGRYVERRRKMLAALSELDR